MTEFADHLHEHMEAPVVIDKGCYRAPTVSKFYCIVLFNFEQNLSLNFLETVSTKTVQMNKSTLFDCFESITEKYM